MVKTKERMKDQTKNHAAEQINYGRLHQPGPLIIEKGGIRSGANQEIRCGSQEEIYPVDTEKYVWQSK